MRKKSRWRKALAGVILVLVLAGAVAWAALPGIVRGRVEARAEAAGLEVSVGSVRVRASGVHLADIEVRSHRFPGQRVSLDQLDVLLDSSLNVREVRGRGGSVTLQGPWQDLRDQLRAFRQGGEGTGQGRRRARTPVSVSGLSLTWDGLAEEAKLHVEGITISRRETMTASAKSTRLIRGGSSLVVKNATWDGVKARADSAKMGKVAGESKGMTGKPSTKSRPWEALASVPPIRAEVEVSEVEVSVDGRELTASGVELRFRREESIWVSVKADSVRSPVANSGKFWTTVKLDIGEGSTKVDLVMDAENLVTSHPAIAKEDIEIGHLQFEGSFSLTEEGAVSEALVDVGKVRISLNASGNEDNVSGRVSMGMTPCQDIIESIPKSMTRTIDGMKMSGAVGFDIVLNIELPERKDPSVSMVLRNECRVESVPDGLRTSALRKPFKYEVYSRDGKKLRERTSGPGSPGWVSLQMVSRFVPMSVRTMEDPGFWAHRGFHVEAIENSIKENIRTGRFARGASTISMQLAKNLWLQRERTAGRKIQEAFLTMWLEQSLTKEQILELYVNVVEFGPDVYGLKAGAHHYFRIHPVNLSLGQSLFLASILPRPKSYYFGPDGKLGPRKAWNLRGVMKSMKEQLKISEDEYQNGVTEVLVFRHPSTSATVDEEDVPVSTDGIDPESWD